ncbi:hypothetical protein HYFRA_00013777 [Hymenoscyphus fraxineus]|uniref:FAD-binding domain-containing protein n=1 Tax=Hymenoscyphus fraxineus TaxID=746836 RepID=A0A9N9L6X9_9HELO|nr:hypothetical protein HYFRA_00013777 [Hymenoscyphus fraxineus]
MNAAGFHVQVFEKVHNFARLGDSLGLGENALRLLKRWGLYEQLIAIGNKSEMMQIRRWDDGKILAQQPLMDMAGYIGHRGDYHEEFLKRVREVGVEVRMGCNVVAYDEEGPSVRLGNGEVHEADLIVAADGIKSLAREVVLGFEDKPKSSGYACYRAFFKGAYLKDLPLCRGFIEQECVNIWIGNDIHLVQNTLRDGDEVNWIITHKDTEDIKESWFLPGDMEAVRKLVLDCDPRIKAVVDATKNAQGASQAIESAAVLAMCLKLAGKERIPLALCTEIFKTRTYEKLRFERVRLSQLNGEELRDRWHSVLKDLDRNVEIDPEDVKIRNRWLYPFDAEEDTIQRWPEVSAMAEKELSEGKIRPLFMKTE